MVGAVSPGALPSAASRVGWAACWCREKRENLKRIGVLVAVCHVRRSSRGTRGMYETIQHITHESDTRDGARRPPPPHFSGRIWPNLAPQLASLGPVPRREALHRPIRGQHRLICAFMGYSNVLAARAPA